MIFTYLSFSVPVSIWMLKGFFDVISIEMEEAAIIDGCNRLTAFFRVVLPIARPGIVATIVWILISTWQELLFALSIITSEAKRTISIGVLDFSGQYFTDYGALFAGSVLVSIPIAVIFISLQKHFVAGLAEGSVKG